MTMPFYVSPEQLMKDRADYARKGIGRGRSVAVVQYADGILFVSENPSQALHKISEIYDRIGFAAVGRYNEFENLRIAGVRLADLRGYSYDRRDVTGRGLANAYAQTLGSIFSSGGEKPYEVELFVAELGESSAGDQVFRLTYDGQVADEQGFAAMGGQAESVTSYLSERWRDGLSLTDALRLAVAALGHGDGGEDRTIPPADLEVAVLDRTRTQQRKFRRIGDALLEGMLDGPPPGPPDAPGGDDGSGDDGSSGDGEGDSGDRARDDGEQPPADDAQVAPATAVALAPVALDGPEGDEPEVDEPEVDELPDAPSEEPASPALDTEPHADAPVEDSAPEGPAFDAETVDPVEVASAESPVSELALEQEAPAHDAPADDARADDAPADDEQAEQGAASSEEEWPPVAPPLPSSPVDQPAEGSEGAEGTASEEDLWPLADTTDEAPATDETTGDDTSGDETTEQTTGEPVTSWSDQPEDPPTQVLSSDDDPLPPRADRPPPPAPVEPVEDPGDGPEATEDLEREWSPEGGGGGSFFDLYGDTAAQESSSSTESDRQADAPEDAEATDEPDDGTADSPEDEPGAEAEERPEDRRY